MLQTLGSADAPPVLNRDLLWRYAKSARNGEAVPDSTLSWWIKRAVDERKLERVQRGLYLNALRARPGRLADAINFFHADAVVSLNTALGDAGVLNNPTRVVTAVVPINAGFPPPKLGRKRTAAGTLHFFGLPRRVLEAGRPQDRLEPTGRYEHPRATPEKALIDWLYLGRSARSRRPAPPRDDIDLSMLDMRRLRRLAAEAGLGEPLESFLSQVRTTRPRRRTPGR